MYTHVPQKIHINAATHPLSEKVTTKHKIKLRMDGRNHPRLVCKNFANNRNEDDQTT